MSEPGKQSAPRESAALRGWQSLASLRLGVALLVVLAVASTVGTVLPQPESFNLSSYITHRLDFRAEHALKPTEFVALARAAGILGGDPAFEAVAKQAAEGTLDEAAWPGFLARFSQQVQRDEEGQRACLRLFYADSYGTLLGRVLLFLQIHVVFASAWFRVLCVLLVANLVACSARRLPGQWRSAFGLRASDDPAWYSKRTVHATVARRGGGADGAAVAERVLRECGFRVEMRAAGDVVTLDGARGWLGGLGTVWRPLRRLAGVGRLGAQVVHLGIVLIIVGGFVSGRLSSRHPQLLARGDIVAVPASGDTAANTPDWREMPDNASGNALFRMRLRWFEFRTDSRGKPEYYGSHVTLLDRNPPTDLTIEVNAPLIYRGFHVYQQSYQPDYRGITSVSFLIAKMRRAPGGDGESSGEDAPMEVLQQVSLAVPPDARVLVPGTGLALRVLRYFPHWQVPLARGPDGEMTVGEAKNLSDEPMNPAVQVELEAAGVKPRKRWIPLPFRSGEPRPGGVIDYGQYRIIPMDFAPAYATWLTFKTHPVMLPVWIGCGVVMLGVVLCFYCNHERVWAMSRPAGDGRCQVLLAGDSFKWRERFRERFASVVKGIEETR